MSAVEELANRVYDTCPALHWLWFTVMGGQALCGGEREDERIAEAAALVSREMHLHSQLPKTEFQRWLFEHGACIDGRVFVGGMTPESAVDSAVECDHLDWIEWLLDAAEEGVHDDYARELAELCRDGLDRVAEHDDTPAEAD